MLKPLLPLVAAISISACNVNPELAAMQLSVMQTPPAQLNATQIAHLSGSLFETCRAYNLGSYANPQTKTRVAHTAADVRKLESILRRHGLTGRDLELLRSRDRSFGTGQTFRGLTCSLGYAPRVNRAFYPGTGHNWQAILGSQYVYLRGDGSETGMKVYAWN